LLALALYAAFPAVRAQPATVLNMLRAGACRPAGASASQLAPDRLLSEAAERIAAGARPRAALASSGFRARQSRTLAASGIDGDQALAAIIQKRFCREIGTSSLTRVGIARHGDRIWIVLAEPLAAPALVRPARVPDEVLSLVNEARRGRRSCGAASYPAAGPLTRSQALERAAAAHAKDMIRRDELSHAGADGSTPGERALQAGYRWRVIGENIAAGPDSAQQVVAGWLASPEHCANIMDTRFTEMGVAFEIDWRRASGIYWAQELGRPATESRR